MTTLLASGGGTDTNDRASLRPSAQHVVNALLFVVPAAGGSEGWRRNVVLQVRNVMTRSLISTDRLATLADAISLMSSWRVGSVVVTVEGRPIGLVDEADLARAVMLEGAPLDAPLYVAASRTPLRISPDARVQDALDLCRRQGARHVLVDDDGSVVGLVSVTDLLPPALDTDGVDLFSMAVSSAQRAAIVGEATIAGDAATPDPLPAPWPVSEATAYVAAAWPGTVDNTRDVEEVGNALVEILPVVVGAAPGSATGRRPLHGGDGPTALLAAVTGSVAPYRVGAFAEMLDVLSAPVHDASAAAVSLAAGCGVGPDVSLPQALLLLDGSTQLGGLVQARRAGESAAGDIRVTDQRVGRLRAVLAALRSHSSSVIDLREPAHADLAWYVAALLDALEVPLGFEAPLIACARSRGWADLHRVEATRLVAPADAEAASGATVPVTTST